MNGVFQINGLGNSDWVAVVAPGSTQTHYQENHPLVELLKNYFSQIYSIDLPGHGSLQHMLPRDVHHAMDIFLQTVSPFVNGKKVVFFGFSLGGILALKNWSALKKITHRLIGVMIGVGLKIDELTIPSIRMFFTERHYRISGWEKKMEEMHGENWRALVNRIGEWFDPMSSPNIYLNDNELHNINGQEVYYIVANRDQAFSLEGFSIFPDLPLVDLVSYTALFTGPDTSLLNPLDPCDLSPRVFIVSGHHFSYFHPKAAFPLVKYIISYLLDCLNV